MVNWQMPREHAHTHVKEAVAAVDLQAGSASAIKKLELTHI